MGSVESKSEGRKGRTGQNDRIEEYQDRKIKGSEGTKAGVGYAVTVRVVRLYDPSRQPPDWMDLIQPGEVAAFPLLIDGEQPCDADGRPTGHGGAVCLLFESLLAAERFCEAQVQGHPAVRFDVFDHAGRSCSPSTPWCSPDDCCNSLPPMPASNAPDWRDSRHTRPTTPRRPPPHRPDARATQKKGRHPVGHHPFDWLWAP